MTHSLKVALSVAALALAACAHTDEPERRPRMATEIPPDITTPRLVDTRLGALEFVDGIPTEATAAKVYDNLDFLRGVEAFLTAMPGASVYALREGARQEGYADGTIAITEQLMDSKPLFLTANTDTVYALAWLDLRNGPLVVESPPDTLGIVDDFWFHYVTDLGNAGPDRGKGGKYLFLPPDYKGTPPRGYYTFKSPTYGNLLFWRGFQVKGDPRPAVENIKRHARIYPLADAKKVTHQKFIDISGRAFNTIHASDYHFYEEVNAVVQEEPSAAMDPETLGLLASIGIEKGKPFAPDERMKKILVDAVAVGNATARAIVFRSRLAGTFLYPNSQWQVAFYGGSYLFEQNGARLLDARTRFFYYATGVTPAMAIQRVGIGSQYALCMNDSHGQPFDGGRSYRLRIPPNPPAKDFWSVVVYDNQTRSELQTDQEFPSLNSERAGLAKNADGSIDVYFGPQAPAGKEANWIQTEPDKGWNTILRLYGPLEPWFAKTWKPGEIEPLE
jgi:hypothetical protein